MYDSTKKNTNAVYTTFFCEICSLSKNFDLQLTYSNFDQNALPKIRIISIKLNKNNYLPITVILDFPKAVSKNPSVDTSQV